MFFLKNRSEKGSIDPKKWGLERATLELLNQADKDWVTFRYSLCLEYIESDKDILLDASCGTGFGSCILSSKAGLVIGIDKSEESLQYARSHFGSPKIEYIRGLVEKIPFKENYFDLSIGIETIEHIKNYRKYLNELKRITKRNGKLLISTPQKKSETVQTPFHIKEFYYHEFKTLLQQYFVVDKIIGLKRREKPICDLVDDSNYFDFDIYLAACLNTEK